MNPEEEAIQLAKLKQAGMMLGPNPMAPVVQPGSAMPEQDFTTPAYKGVSAQPTAASALAQALQGWGQGRSMRQGAKGKGPELSDGLRRAAKVGMSALEHPVQTFQNFVR